jgi:hypothetical protein
VRFIDDDDHVLPRAQFGYPAHPDIESQLEVRPNASMKSVTSGNLAAVPGVI